MYKLFYILMLVGYFGVSMQVPTWKMKSVGILLLIVNAIIFYK